MMETLNCSSRGALDSRTPVCMSSLRARGSTVRAHFIRLCPEFMESIARVRAYRDVDHGASSSSTKQALDVPARDPRARPIRAQSSIECSED